MEKENKPRRRKDWKCEVCGKELKEELVLNDIVWADVCKKANTPNLPRDTLICPECIEKTLGRSLKLEELLKVSRMSGLEVALPINYWYMRKHKYIQQATPYIKNHIQTYLTGRIRCPDIFSIWLKYIPEPRNKYEKELVDIMEEQYNKLAGK